MQPQWQDKVVDTATVGRKCPRVPRPRLQSKNSWQNDWVQDCLVCSHDFFLISHLSFLPFPKWLSSGLNTCLRTYVYFPLLSSAVPSSPLSTLVFLVTRSRWQWQHHSVTYAHPNGSNGDTSHSDGRICPETDARQSLTQLVNITDNWDIVRQLTAQGSASCISFGIRFIYLTQLINKDLLSVFLLHKHSKPQAHILTANFAGYNFLA